MNDPLNREDLLSELFTEPESHRTASLNDALNELRKARRLRSARRTAFSIGALLLAALCVSGKFQQKWPKPAAPIAVASAIEASRGIPILTDDELLDHFPGRAVALVGRAEHRRLIFLDAGEEVGGP